MAIGQKHIIVYGATTMPDSDTPTGIGGANSDGAGAGNVIKVTFGLVASTGIMRIKSENVGDTTQTLTVHGRNAAGDIVSEGIALTGQTVTSGSTSFERILKVVKSATCAGIVAAYSTTAVRSDTAVSATADTLVLDASASASDDFYTGKVLIITGATAGAHQIREIVSYTGSSKTCFVRDWGTTPTSVISFSIFNGSVFEKAPAEIDIIRRPFYDAAAEATGGSARTYYDKVFFHNIHATLSLTTATLAEVAEGASAKIDFAMESTLDNSDTNGAGNRQTHTGGYTFNSTTKNIVNSQSLTAGSGQGVWLKLSLAAGDVAANSFSKLRLSGQSV